VAISQASSIEHPPPATTAHSSPPTSSSFFALRWILVIVFLYLPDEPGAFNVVSREPLHGIAGVVRGGKVAGQAHEGVLTLRPQVGVDQPLWKEKT
jgi:hypothetical protein